jgi:hypothetical protein
MKSKIFQVEGANGLGCFNYHNLRQVSSFQKELNLSSEVKQIGMGYLNWPNKTFFYNLNGSDLVLENLEHFPLPDLTISGRDEEHINKTLEILMKKYPQIKIKEIKSIFGTLKETA